MVAAANLVEVAALVGYTARATILAALMSGQALTGSELAYLARVSRPTASEHLARLTEARLIASIKQGRFRYYRIVSPLVASWVFSTFTGPAAPVLLPGAPFIVSALAYGLAIWAVSGVRPVAALVGADAGVTVAASTETGGHR